jgi:hypothetical protein
MKKIPTLLIMVLCFFAFTNKTTGQSLTKDDYSKLARLFAVDVQLKGDSRENYANYQSTRSQAPFSHSKVLTLNEKKANKEVSKILVIVTSEMYAQLPDKIARYANDINDAYGCQVIMESVTGGNHIDIKNLILSHQTNLDGAVLIGDIAVSWYEVEDDFEEYGYAVWPCDLYYMDLDGEWLDYNGNGIFDMHTGDLQPEIFVGRISTANMGKLWSEVAGLEHYLDKNHKFWIGSTPVNQKFGLTYTDHDWVMWNDFKTDINYLYGSSNYDKIAWGEDPCFGKSDYLNRLKDDRYEFIQLSCHASHEYLQMSGGGFYSNEIFNVANEAIGYNLFCCSACNWTEVSPNSTRGFLGGVHAYNPNNSALVAVGSTKTGSMLNFYQFYIPLGEGKSIGESLKLWWINAYGTVHDFDVICWHYGMSIIGDPMVNFLYSAPTSWNIGFPNPADVTATFGGNTITINGTGAMKNWEVETDVPWNYIKDDIKSVIIHNEVTTIGDWAFADCSHLSNVTVSWEIPPAVSSTVFDRLLLSNINLHILQCEESEYIAAPLWQEFNIVKLSFTITPSADSKGTISPKTAQDVDCENDITFTATPNDHYEVDCWSVNDAIVQTGGDSYTISNVQEDATINVTFKQLIKIDEQAAQTIQIYPNPATGELTIDNGQLTITSIEIFDVFGRKCHAINSPSNFEGVDGEPGRGSLKINISHLPKGVYILKVITTDGDAVLQKIVKE